MTLRRSMSVLLALTGSALAGCGSIAYGESAEETILETTTTTRTVAVSVPQEAPPPIVVHSPPPIAVAPPPPIAVAPPPPVYAAPLAQGRNIRWSRGNGPVQCSGSDQIVVHDIALDGGHGPAVLATGRCVVHVSESILRGAPAIVIRDGAQVRVAESRVHGDVLEMVPGSFRATGSRHRGHVIAAHQ